jgi:hypothetical protein
MNSQYSIDTLTAETLKTSDFMRLQVPEILTQLPALKTSEEVNIIQKRYINYPEIYSEIPCHPDRLWGPPNLLSNGYRG